MCVALPASRSLPWWSCAGRNPCRGDRCRFSCLGARRWCCQRAPVPRLPQPVRVPHLFPSACGAGGQHSAPGLPLLPAAE
eukprot:5204091-Heterocapsa_arctica.AAC.1